MSQETEMPCAISEGEPRGGETLLPLRFLGMGLWIVWQWATHGNATIYFSGYQGMGVSFAICDFTMRVADIVTMVVLALLWRRLTPITSHGRLEVLACLSVAVGTTGMLLCLNGLILSAVLTIAFSCLAAFGGAVLFLSWAEVYSRLATERMLFMGVLSLILAGAVSFLLNHLAAPLPTVGTVAVPVVSCILCWLSGRFVAPRPINLGELGIASLRIAFPWKPVAVMAFAGFTAGFGNFALFDQNANTRMLATFVVGVIVLAVSFAFKGRLRLGHLAGGAFVIALAGFVLIAAMGTTNPVPAAFLIMLAYIALCVVGLSLLGRLSFIGLIPSLWLFGLGRAASELMMGLGSYARYVPGMGQMPHDKYALAVLAVAGTVCLMLIALLWRSEDSIASNWAVNMVDVRSGRPVESQHDMLARGCEIIAVDAGLTQRECEVLQQLVFGQSYQQICQSLMVSMGTVKTHIRHIYAKLGVHSRDEAFDVIKARGSH